MGRQLGLVWLLFVALGLQQGAHSHKRFAADHIIRDMVADNRLDSVENFLNDMANNHNLPLLFDHRNGGIKISTPKVKDAPTLDATTSVSTKKAETTTAAVATESAPAATSSTQQPVSDEILKDLLEASKHSVALAEDPRFNKMLPDRLKAQNVTAPKNSSEENYEDYENYDYDDDYNYDNEETTSVKPKKIKGSSTVPTPKLAKQNPKDSKSINSKTNNIDENDEYADIYDEDDTADDDDDEDDDDDDDDMATSDIADEGEIVFSENVPCPRYCNCARNANSYMVATCSRLDPGTQKFGSDITDLIVTDIGPKYPILLGPKFFHQLGLHHVASIKIANCTIEYMHNEAFHGLDELYAVNLTNVGLAIISPDTFAHSKKLRMLTISGNDLNIMSSVHYLLKSKTIEELDLSRNNLMELNPNAFSQLSNIVYINLSQNNIQKIPKNVFDPIKGIEELDLSYNNLKDLPAGLFNRTSLGILNLKYNSFTDDFSFGTKGISQLDLSYNSIKAVHHGMFDKMTGLTNLNLKGNGITKIQPDSFLTLKGLRHIDLSMNELNQISSMVFYKNSELDVIRLNDNPRLSQLPTDGFLTYNGYFTVYFLDISNCAIGALGHKTFSTMPHLATLKLAWNNINNLERDTFSSLKKITDLDLSNNLISKLDELLFMENNDLTKLNLAGNPIQKLSVRVFLPLNKLRELDVSDCDMTALLHDRQFGVGYKFFETLRSFNASANQIKTISAADIKNFKNLRSLDITRNPLKCNADFQEFISYASLHTHMLPKRSPVIEKLEDATTFVEIEDQAGWAKLAHEVCKREEEDIKYEKKLEKRIEDANNDLDEDARNLLSIIDKSKLNKMQKIMKDSNKHEVVTDDNLSESREDEEGINNGGEDTTDDNDSAYDDDDDEDDDDDDEDDDDDTDGDIVDDEEKEKAKFEAAIDKFVKKHAAIAEQEQQSKSRLKNYGIKVEENDLSKESRDDRYLLNKFGFDNENDDDDSSSYEEDIIIERGHTYYMANRFGGAIIILVICVVIILLCIIKLVSVMLRRRGERYRLALIASTKNSIVYQKLTEDIVKPTTKDAKQQQPKVHRYAPINQV